MIERTNPTLVVEQNQGTTGGHAEAVSLVNRFIDQFEMPNSTVAQGKSAVDAGRTLRIFQSDRGTAHF